jgi:hypothetical protein
MGLVTLGGCRSIAGSTSLPDLPTFEAPTPAPAATPTAGRRASGAAITFARSGGIAGISEQWTIYADGRIAGPAGQTAQVSEAEVSQLLAEIEAAGFFDWSTPARLPSGCADCFSYSLVVTFEGRTNQIRLVDGQQDAPDGAWTVLEGVLDLLESAAGSG